VCVCVWVCVFAREKIENAGKQPPIVAARRPARQQSSARRVNIILF